MKIKNFAVAQRGLGRPDYSATSLQEPWVAKSPDRNLISAGWIHTVFKLNFALPAGEFTTFATLTAEEIESLGIEAVLMEWWIASHPEIYCQCYVGDTMICSPIGCSPGLCHASELTNPSLPISTHIYDTVGDRYGIVCKFHKDIGRGYKVEHGLFNASGVDQTCEVAAISFQRKVTVTG